MSDLPQGNLTFEQAAQAHVAEQLEREPEPQPESPPQAPQHDDASVVEESQQAAEDAELPEAPEEDALEDEPSADAEDSEAVEDETEDEGAEESLFTIMLDGRELEITQDELVKGYIRERTFTKKSQALAEQRKEFTVREQQLAEAEKVHLGVLQEIGEAFAGQVVPMPDPQLFYTDKQAYEEGLMRHNTSKAQADQWNQALQNTAQQVYGRQHQRIQAKIGEELPKLTAAWGLPETGQEETVARVTTLQSSMADAYGIPREAFGNLLDHGFYLAFEDARKWRELQKSGNGKAMRKLKRKGIQPLKTGKANVKPRKVTPGDMANQRFEQTVESHGAGNANLRDVFAQAAAAHAEQYGKR